MGAARRFQRLIVSVAVFLAAVALLFVVSRDAPPDDLLKRARRALANANFEEAEQLARRIPAGSAESSRALLIAGEAASESGKTKTALQYYSRIPADCEGEFLTGLRTAVTISMRIGQLSLTEDFLRRILECGQGNLFATQRLARLLRMAGRKWESTPLFFDLVRKGRCDVEELVLLGGVELRVDVPDTFETESGQKADDPIVLLWQATQARQDSEWSQAESLLRQVIAADPDLVEAHAQLGLVLLESGNAGSLVPWHTELPPTAEDHPGIWFVLGRWLEIHQMPTLAVRCFAEALWRDPDHIAANYRLSRQLIAVERHEAAKLFVSRAHTLQELEDILINLDKNRGDVSYMQQAAELTESLDRLWEAWGWCRVALRRNDRLSWAEQGSRRLGGLLNEDPSRVVVSSSPVFTTDWSEFPLPNREDLGGVSAAEYFAASPRFEPVFENFAESAGLQFRYFNSGDPDSGMVKMYEFTGGGAAVLDFDGDGWADVYLTQGCPWPPTRAASKYRDRLYRNLGNGKFDDATAQAVLVDGGFGQGATSGDYNNDGFPDLYVGNIGENQFWHNNGDGTFTSITESTDTGGQSWTTSCLLADVNGDTWPDLYVVNYLSGEGLFERICRSRDRMPPEGICPPSEFEAEQDRCYLSLGNGRFEDVTGTAGITLPDGKGLGIVAFASDASDSAGLNLFVANDAVANFCFLNETAHPGGSLKFAELGLLSGLALNQNGRAEACMGVAAGDVNHDGRLDLHVTNYHDESNTLYMQQPGGLFVDGTREFGLREPSLSMLGFGTQFLDGDLDGQPDLFVTNGHVDKYVHAGIPYRMRSQYFHNVGHGRFEEIPPATLGPWFSTPCLGRGVAKLDWNRDGREDLIVSLLDADTALLSNQTAVVGHFLVVQLRGVTSDRDAVGTSVSVTTGDVTRFHQLTAGDGYLVSNQRQLIIGLGEVNRVDSLTVKWPSGLSQTFVNIAADQELSIIEGLSNVVRLPPPTE